MGPREAELEVDFNRIYIRIETLPVIVVTGNAFIKDFPMIVFLCLIGRQAGSVCWHYKDMFRVCLMTRSQVASVIVANELLIRSTLIEFQMVMR